MMTNITDINQFRDKANGPDPEQTFTDEEGITWLKFGVDYKDQRGRTMGFHLWATSMEDAKERLELLKSNAVIYGQILSEIE